MPTRLLFIDNIRWSIIILVLSMHASDTYSPFGNWYYTDRTPLSLGERVFFATYQSWLQSFFMAMLFFVAAYFTPASYDHKGAAQYLRDRLIRLILPTFFYICVIGPVTEYYIARSWTGGGGFVHQWIEHVADGEWLSGSGPMWFCVVLFGFSLAYACARLAKDHSRPGSWFGGPPAPSPAVSLVFILAMAVGSFVVRLFSRSDTSILNIHPGDLPQYALMFAAGILAGRGKWLECPLPRATARTSLGALATAAAIWIYIVVRVVTHSDDAGQLNGGINVLSALKCVWEALTCVGMSYVLIALFRRYFNEQGPPARFLSENAFSVYLFHPPIIIACAILLHDITLSGPWKALLLTVVAGIASFSLSQLVFRRIPYLRILL
jgi:glucan biosynthesis protein C